MTIIRIEHSSDYTCLSNKTIREKRLSYKARGLHHLLLSYPNNWTVNINHLVDQSDKDGRAAVMSALSELQEHGYMTMRRVRDKQSGKFIGWEKVIRETPIPQSEAIPTEIRSANVGKKAEKTGATTEVRFSDVGEAEVRFSDVGTEVRKTALRLNRITDKPHDGKSDYIINTDSNKYPVKEVSISPVTLRQEQERVEQLERVKLVEQVEQLEQLEQLESCFSQLETSSTHPLEKQLESPLPGKRVEIVCAHPSLPSQPQPEILPFQSVQTNTCPQTLPSPPLPLENEQLAVEVDTSTTTAVKSDALCGSGRDHRTQLPSKAPLPLSAIEQLKQAESLRWGKQSTPGKDDQGQWREEMIEAIYLSSPSHYSIQIGELKGQKNYHHCKKALDRLEREAGSGKNEALASLKSFNQTAQNLITQRQQQQQISAAREQAQQIPHFPIMPISWHTRLLQAYKALGEEAFIACEDWHKEWLGYAKRYLRQQLLACC